MTERYDYREPRSFNIVTLFLLLIAAAVAYAGYKFGPVYLQAWKVDEILDQHKTLLSHEDLARLDAVNRSTQMDLVVQRSLRGMLDLGIRDTEEVPMEVFYGTDFDTLEAKYQVIVTHPYGKPTVMTMHRKVKVP